MSWTPISSDDSRVPGGPFDRRYPRVIYDFAAAVAVSTETPLLALVELGVEHSDLCFTLRNHDASNPAAFYIEQSESGVVADGDRETVYVEALKERTFEFRDVLRRMWGISAAGDPDNAFPSVNVSWQVVGRLRIR